MISDLTYRAAASVIFFLHFSCIVYAQENLPIDITEKITIVEIQYAGLNKTKPVTLERELLIKRGGVYYQHELEKAAEQSIALLKNLNLFNDIDVIFRETTDSTPNLQICLIKVIEKWYFWPLPFVEFADRNFNQWWQLNLDPGRTNFGLYLFKYNFLGRNQTVKISLVNGYTHNYSLAYNVPFTKWNNKVGYYLKTVHRTNREVWYKTENNKLQFLKDSDNTMITRQLNAGSLFYRINRATTVYFDLGFGEISVNDSVLTAERNPNFLFDGKSSQRQYSAGCAVIKEARNNRLFPWRGHFLGLFTSSIMINNSRNMLNYIGGKAAVYHPFRRNWSISGTGVFKLSSMKDAPYYNFKSLGYSSNVRGFENYVVEGQHFVLFKSGLKYALWNEKKKNVAVIPLKLYRQVPVSIFLDAFFDAGYVVNNSGRNGNDLQNSWLLGTGLGVNMAFYFDKVFRFELTRNSLNQYGVFIHFDKSF